MLNSPSIILVNIKDYFRGSLAFKLFFLDPKLYFVPLPKGDIQRVATCDY